MAHTDSSNDNEAVVVEVTATLQAIIGTDAGGRGMKSLIVPGDLMEASRVFAKLPISQTSHNNQGSLAPLVLVVSGFPCCVQHDPPTETDGPPGTMAICKAALALGYRVKVITDDCNRAVFQAAVDESHGDLVQLVTFPPEPNMTTDDQAKLKELAKEANLIVACERAGPGKDGHCYTMRAIDMTAKQLIAPIHTLVELAMSHGTPFLAIGDGGNELGMGKVYAAILTNPQISNGETIGAVLAADHLVAASVSNWGGYALAAGAALVRAAEDNTKTVQEWVEACLPTEAEEMALLDKCVAAGCRDGVSGLMESTVDGMPLETSLECLRNIRQTCLSFSLLP
eukprot:scaffold121875_cov69-Attheya_sp.AAC.1